MRTRRRAVAVTAVVTGMVLTGGVPAASAANPDTPRKLRQAVNVPAIMKHLSVLESIAKDNDGNRAAGTRGYEASARYVEAILKKAGYQPKRQRFSFVYEQVDAAVLEQTAPESRGIEHIPMSYSPATPQGGVSGDLVVPKVATGCAATDWQGVSATGKVALVARGICTFSQKSTVAKAAGAAAVIITNNADGELNGTLGEINDDHAPTTAVTQAEGQRLREAIAAGPVSVMFQLDKTLETRTSFNILADTREGRGDNVVMLGAHLDSVPAGPGINDNGSGSAAILEVAVQIAKAKQLNNKVRFAWWGAEELGLLGSTYYVEDLVNKRPEVLDDIAAYLNFDMVASPNHIIGVYDADESTYPAPVDVPAGSAEVEKVFTDYFNATREPWVDTEFSGRSDYAPFIAAGVPSSGLFTGADGSKSIDEVELFGGLLGVPYDPNYHTPQDSISNINALALDVMSDAIATAAITLAQDTTDVNGVGEAARRGAAGAAGQRGVSGSTKQKRVAAALAKMRSALRSAS